MQGGADSHLPGSRSACPGETLVDPSLMEHCEPTGEPEAGTAPAMLL